MPAPTLHQSSAGRRRIQGCFQRCVAPHGNGTECVGNQTRAANKLGMARATLIECLQRYGTKRPPTND
jgi:hypothetical protein